MPEVSRFFGIVVRIFFADHDPPHFHAEYGEHEALIALDSMTIHRGSLPPRALALVLEWAALHQDELRLDWQLARSGRPIAAIAPLD